jgi:hypothetical protein
MPNITHTFVSLKPEQSDPTLVGPNEWNAVHTMAWFDEYFTSTDAQTNFTPVKQPTNSSLVFVNGVKMRPGPTYDYTIVGTDIVFNYYLNAGQVVEVLT